MKLGQYDSIAVSEVEQTLSFQLLEEEVIGLAFASALASIPKRTVLILPHTFLFPVYLCTVAAQVLEQEKDKKSLQMKVS